VSWIGGVGNEGSGEDEVGAQREPGSAGSGLSTSRELQTGSWPVTRSGRNKRLSTSRDGSDRNQQDVTALRGRSSPEPQPRKLSGWGWSEAPGLFPRTVGRLELLRLADPAVWPEPKRPPTTSTRTAEAPIRHEI